MVGSIEENVLSSQMFPNLTINKENIKIIIICNKIKIYKKFKQTFKQIGENNVEATLIFKDKINF